MDGMWGGVGAHGIGLLPARQGRCRLPPDEAGAAPLQTAGGRDPLGQGAREPSLEEARAAPRRVRRQWLARYNSRVNGSKKPKGAATLSAAPHWITPGKNYLQGEANLGRHRVNAT